MPKDIKKRKNITRSRKIEKIVKKEARRNETENRENKYSQFFVFKRSRKKKGKKRKKTIVNETKLRQLVSNNGQSVMFV